MNEPTMTTEECEQAIDARPAPRVTKRDIEARIKTVSYVGHGIAPTLTICSIELDNGYSVRGESACVDIRNFDVQIGQRLAFDDAFRKLWPLFGFLLAEDLYRAHHPVHQWETWERVQVSDVPPAA